jgi:hypothetical protein
VVLLLTDTLVFWIILPPQPKPSVEFAYIYIYVGMYGYMLGVNTLEVSFHNLDQIGMYIDMSFPVKCVVCFSHLGLHMFNYILFHTFYIYSFIFYDVHAYYILLLLLLIAYIL